MTYILEIVWWLRHSGEKRLCHSGIMKRRLCHSGIMKRRLRIRRFEKRLRIRRFEKRLRIRRFERRLRIRRFEKRLRIRRYRCWDQDKLKMHVGGHCSYCSGCASVNVSKPWCQKDVMMHVVQKRLECLKKSLEDGGLRFNWSGTWGSLLFLWTRLSTYFRMRLH